MQSGTVPLGLLRQLDNEDAAAAAVSGGRVADMLALLPPPLLACGRVWGTAMAADGAGASEALARLKRESRSAVYARRWAPVSPPVALASSRVADLYPDAAIPADARLACEVLEEASEQRPLVTSPHAADVQCSACQDDLFKDRYGDDLDNDDDDDIAIPAEGKIWQCGNGHLVCNVCHFQLAATATTRGGACPVCRCPAPRARCLLAERLRDAQPRRCHHCARWFSTGTSRDAHEEVCAARPLGCPVCGAAVPLALLDGHLERHAPCSFSFSSPSSGSDLLRWGGIIVTEPAGGYRMIPAEGSFDSVFLLRGIDRRGGGSSSPRRAVVRLHDVRRDEGSHQVCCTVQRCDGALEAAAGDDDKDSRLLARVSLRLLPDDDGGGDDGCRTKKASTVAVAVVCASWAYPLRRPPPEAGACLLPLPRWITDRREARFELHVEFADGEQQP